MEAEHRLLEQLFPRHILQYMAEEWTSNHFRRRRQLHLQQQLQQRLLQPLQQVHRHGHAEGAAGSAVAVAGPGLAEERSVGASSELNERPVVRDCNALATLHPQVGRSRLRTRSAGCVLEGCACTMCTNPRTPYAMPCERAKGKPGPVCHGFYGFVRRERSPPAPTYASG